MVLGRPTAESTQYGKQDYTVVPIEGLELADQLHDAVKVYSRHLSGGRAAGAGRGARTSTNPSRLTPM